MIEDAYIAGLFDGEGSVGIYRVTNGKHLKNGESAPSARKVYWTARLSIVGAHRPMIEAAWKAVGLGLFTTQKRQSIQRTPRADYSVIRLEDEDVRLCRQGWKWMVTDRKGVRVVLERVRPYLIEKAEQVDIVLAFLRGEMDGDHASQKCKDAKRFSFPIGDYKEYALRRIGANRGQDNPCSTISPETVRLVRETISSGESQESVAERFGIGQSSVSRIVRGAHWAHRE